MNEMQIFSNKDFGEVRTVMIDGEPWFVANDVARILEYKDLYSAARKNVDDEDKRVCPVGSTYGIQDTVVINESGLYSLIFGSKMDKAKDFKRWVTSEVLPQIRKTGEYKKQDSYMIEDPVERAKRWIEEQEEKKLLESKNAELESQNKEMSPKALVYDQMIDSRLLVNFRDAAKEIGISQSQFTGWLKDKGYVYSNSAGELRPMEAYMESGLFEMKPYQNPHNGHAGSRTYLTPRGLAAFKIILEETGHNRYTMQKHGGRNGKKR